MAQLPTKTKKAAAKTPNRSTKRAVKPRASKKVEKEASEASEISGDLDEDDRKELEGRDFSALIKQVQSEHTQGWWFIKPKWDE